MTHQTEVLIHFFHNQPLVCFCGVPLEGWPNCEEIVLYGRFLSQTKTLHKLTESMYIGVSEEKFHILREWRWIVALSQPFVAKKNFCDWAKMCK